MNLGDFCVVGSDKSVSEYRATDGCGEHRQPCPWFWTLCDSWTPWDWKDRHSELKAAFVSQFVGFTVIFLSFIDFLTFIFWIILVKMKFKKLKSREVPKKKPPRKQTNKQVRKMQNVEIEVWQKKWHFLCRWSNVCCRFSQDILRQSYAFARRLIGLQIYCAGNDA